MPRGTQKDSPDINNSVSDLKLSLFAKYINEVNEITKYDIPYGINPQAQPSALLTWNSPVYGLEPEVSTVISEDVIQQFKNQSQDIIKQFCNRSGGITPGEIKTETESFSPTFDHKLYDQNMSKIKGSRTLQEWLNGILRCVAISPYSFKIKNIPPLFIGGKTASSSLRSDTVPSGILYAINSIKEELNHESSAKYYPPQEFDNMFSEKFKKYTKLTKTSDKKPFLRSSKIHDLYNGATTITNFLSKHHSTKPYSPSGLKDCNLKWNGHCMRIPWRQKPSFMPLDL